ncbi:MAG: ATP cone domain-containing protein, partial [Finegoldia magna]|nr:ATP cone domain-containing protein [Finegoldia magna]
MEIKKRDGNIVDFDRSKIELAMKKAYASVGIYAEQNELESMAQEIENTVVNKYPKNHVVTVEEIQDLVELTLIDHGQYKVVKSFILYRAKHTTDRKVIEEFEKFITDDDVIEIIRYIQEHYDSTRYSIENLYLKFESFVKPNLSQYDMVNLLSKASGELVSKEAPNWEYIASLFMNYNLKQNIKKLEIQYDLQDFKSKIKFLDERGLYGSYIREVYTDDDIDELEKYMDDERDKLFTFSALDLIIKRYLIKTHDNRVIESAQEMFMGIAMHLALKEKDRIHWAKKIYDNLSKLKVTVATPTMSNARKPFNQLSSCFIDTVPDTLEGIYRSINNFAQVSKHGGGMGLYFGKVRANGSDIRGFQGVAGGVIRWIKLANDTAVAVDQLGVRQGSVAVYLDVWHKDILEFLQLRTNNGDDRMKAHDVFPSVCYPDLFWKMVRDDIDGTWYMFDPHEISVKKGYNLEDYYGDEWEKRYNECVLDESISRRSIKVKDLVRLIIKSWTETGTPFTFNRDTVNRMNPNKHKGMIYSSNLCTEIMQNMSEIHSISETIETEDGDDIIVTKTKPGDFVVCNLA